MNSFKRGNNIKSSLNIGNYRLIKDPTLKNWSQLPSGHYFVKSVNKQFVITHWDAINEEWRLSDFQHVIEKLSMKTDGPPLQLRKGYPGIIRYPPLFGGGTREWIDYMYIKKIDSLSDIKSIICE